MRNVNINSIRYYEKQEILLPAWIDPKTKYRYYLPEQINILDAILLCIRLGIPLKELKRYIDQEGRLDEKGVLEYGEQVLENSLSQIQRTLEITRFNLKSLEENKEYSRQTGVYDREIEKRYLLAAPFYGDWDNLIEKEKAAAELYNHAQALGMSPVFPAGILIRCDIRPALFSFFVQILYPPQWEERVIVVPKSTFRCVQADIKPDTDILKAVDDNIAMPDRKTIIISKVISHKLDYKYKHCEIQVSDTSFTCPHRLRHLPG